MWFWQGAEEDDVVANPGDLKPGSSRCGIPSCTTKGVPTEAKFGVAVVSRQFWLRIWSLDA